jgi:hypothetical protein
MRFLLDIIELVRWLFEDWDSDPMYNLGEPLDPRTDNLESW